MSDFPTPRLVAEETGDYVLEQQAYLELVYTAQALSAKLGEVFAAARLSGKQYNVLRALRRAGEPGLTPSQILEQLVERGADVTRLVDRLIRQGLVSRRHAEDDRRVVLITLTARGHDLVASLDAPVLAAHKAQLGHMSAADLAGLIGLLRTARQSDG